MLNLKEQLLDPCPKCGKDPSWGITKIVDSRGRERFPYFCKSCGERTQFYVKKKLIPAELKNSVPVKVYEPKLGICERCKKVDHVEEHHCAPRELFEDANQWPKIKLCMKCHEEWHFIMNQKRRANEASPRND